MGKKGGWRDKQERPREQWGDHLEGCSSQREATWTVASQHVSSLRPRGQLAIVTEGLLPVHLGPGLLGFVLGHPGDGGWWGTVKGRVSSERPSESSVGDHGDGERAAGPLVTASLC